MKLLRLSSSRLSRSSEERNFVCFAGSASVSELLLTVFGLLKLGDVGIR